MLFDKSNKGQTELKELLGFLYAGNNFVNMKTDILLVEEEIIEYIGQAVYDKAETHYKSENFETGGEHELLDELVKHIQLPVAYYAVHNYSSHNDVTHSGSGRKVSIDAANEKMAWEWMIARDDEATLNKAHKTTDRLIAFLEKNTNNIAEWKDSDAQKMARSLFINNAKDFDAIFPIDKSRRFFIKILPFIKEVERKHILPVLGKTQFDDIKAAIKAGEFTDLEDMLMLIKVPLVYYALSLAVKRLSVNILPSGIFQDYISEFQTQKARKPAPTEVRKEIQMSLLSDANQELTSLQKELDKIASEALDLEYIPEDLGSRIDPEKPIFRL